MFRDCYWTTLHSHNQTWTRILWFGFLILSCSITADQNHRDSWERYYHNQIVSMWKGCKGFITGQKLGIKFRFEGLLWLIVAFLYWLMPICSSLNWLFYIWSVLQWWGKCQWNFDSFFTVYMYFFHARWAVCFNFLMLRFTFLVVSSQCWDIIWCQAISECC